MILLAVLWLAAGATVHAQDFSYRGFAELQSTAYPQTTPADDDQLSIEGRVRFEPAYRATGWLTLAASVDARLDTLAQVERHSRLDVADRRARRPALSLRQASATVRRGGLVADVGRQFIRWGKADILTPTDRFAPRDFLEVTDDEFLAVWGVRTQIERGAQTFDVAWVPVFTPSRVPLPGRRWAGAAPVAGVRVVHDTPLPGRDQVGVRWSVLAPGFDFSVAGYDGLNHLPRFALLESSADPVPTFVRGYAPIRMIGADAAVPLRWFTAKGELAALFARDDAADSVFVYVIQVERQSGELSLVGGYAGETLIERRSLLDFSPDRGLARAFLGRAAYTLGPTRDVSVEGVVRQNLDGIWVKTQYSQAIGTHWRLTLAGTAIGGEEGDFIGQYRRNSHVLMTARYSY